ncbi:MAG: hypothetical protein HC919_09980 [Oscillatoriales cyanobacterium SM2_2_1]|nr:hypothetical protein [Oscillatoriales cyanobacterium SM2_2_1]
MLPLVACTAAETWTAKDREDYIWDCAVVIDRQSRGQSNGMVTRAYCTCVLAETESRYAPEEARGNFQNVVAKLPPIAVKGCQQKTGL